MNKNLSHDDYRELIRGGVTRINTAMPEDLARQLKSVAVRETKQRRSEINPSYIGRVNTTTSVNELIVRSVVYWLNQQQRSKNDNVS